MASEHREAGNKDFQHRELEHRELDRKQSEPWASEGEESEQRNFAYQKFMYKESTCQESEENDSLQKESDHKESEHNESEHGDFEPSEFAHVTVLLEEAVDNLLTDPDGAYVDCTLGGAGHSRLILSRLGGQGRLIGFDQDSLAIRHAEKLFAGDMRVTLVHSNFSFLAGRLQALGVLPVQGILFDLGVSSPQLDVAERGFSYMQDAPLDMRMDPSRTLTAAEIVNSWGEDAIRDVLWRYGEEKWAKRIAEFIVREREVRPFSTTGELVAVIKAAIPASARREGPHPAKRTFQALRIAVNDELGVLEQALDQAIDCLAPGGRLAIITFHSLEDRIVKERMQSWLGRCTCPPGFPVCRCGAQAVAKIITRKPILPSDEEVERNPRARSAKLRVAEKLEKGLQRNLNPSQI